MSRREEEGSKLLGKRNVEFSLPQLVMDCISGGIEYGAHNSKVSIIRALP